MKLVVKAADTSDLVSLRTWQPEDDKVVSTWVRLAISAKGKDGADDFFLKVATPAGLARDQSIKGVVASRPLLVVESYDFRYIWDWVSEVLAACEAESWPACVENLRRYFNWEYDDYQEK